MTLEYRSVPVDTALPHVIYQNLREAMAWLTKAFGFQEYYRYDDVERRLNVGRQSRYLKCYRLMTGGRAFVRLGA